MAKKFGNPFPIFCDDENLPQGHLGDRTDFSPHEPRIRLDTHIDDNEETPNFYRTSLSSLPQSSTTSDAEHEDYTPASDQKAPTRNTTILHRPRNSISRYSSSLTPRSVRSARIRVSPRPRTRERQEEQDRLDHPLVLLHITILPVSLPWSQEHARKILPAETIDDLNLLKDKTSGNVTQRGILIPHPQDEMDLIRERLLEALELEKPRDTACDCLSRQSMDDEDDSDSMLDSAIGMSEDENDQYVRCEVCFARIKGSDVSKRTEKRWEVKVFAANGLMRENTWSSSWNEMERVDIEISPCIPLDLRKRLDDLRQKDEMQLQRQRAQELENREDSVARIEQLLQQHRADLDHIRHLESQMRTVQGGTNGTTAESDNRHASASQPTKHNLKDTTSPLPPAYRPKEIPLDVLVKNYFCVLARDKRNMVIFGLSVLVLFLAVQSQRSIYASSQMGSTPIRSSDASTLSDATGHLEVRPVLDASMATIRDSIPGDQSSRAEEVPSVDMDTIIETAAD